MKNAKQFFCILFVIFSVCLSLFAQRGKSVLLPESEVKNLTEQCSRDNAPAFSATWKPLKKDIVLMESKFSQINKLKAKGCCNQGAQVLNSEEFFMQYVGLIIKGKKYIYISAFVSSPSYRKWREEAIAVCDGGKGYWGILYNIRKKKFSDLSVNGQ